MADGETAFGPKKTSNNADNNALDSMDASLFNGADGLSDNAICTNLTITYIRVSSSYNDAKIRYINRLSAQVISYNIIRFSVCDVEVKVYITRQYIYIAFQIELPQ